MQIKDMTTRQKAIIIVFVLVIIFLIWQVIGIFKGGSTTTITQTFKNKNMPASQMVMPQSASLPKKPAPMTEREIALVKLQQQTEEKYLNALNELQMLKIERDIAETNKAIASAKFDTATAQKNTIDLLTKPVAPEGNYAQGLTNPTAAARITTPPPAIVSTEANYVVISVSQLQQRWNAVLGYQGKLFTVSVGDILPADGSKVISIDKSGVMLEKDNVKKKISLVPII